MDTFPESCMSDALNTRQPLLTVGAGVDVSAAGVTVLTVADVARFAYILYLEAICLVASTTSGTWILETDQAGVDLLDLAQPVTASEVGTRYCWPFPHPWKTPNIGGRFQINASVATMGTWKFTCNGFLSST